MSKAETKKKIAMLSFEVLAFTVFFLFGKTPASFEWIIFFLFVGSAFFSFSFFNSKLKNEREQKKKFSSSTVSENVLIFTVIKNDISAAKRFVEHYGNFPPNFNVIVFDDSSNDGTYEYLIETSKKFKNVEVKRLVRSGRTLHPKGEGFERVLKEADEDLIFLCDGDSLISLKDLNFLIFKLEKEKLDYVSAQRRNIEKEKISYYSADTNELFMSLMNAFVTPFGGSIFPGSGHLFKKSSFKDFRYGDVCLSDDTYIGNWIIQNKKLGKKIYSASVKELAPNNFLVKISQMLKWTKNGVLERTRTFSLGALIEYSFLFTVIFSFVFFQTYFASLIYSVLAILFGTTLGMVFAFKKIKNAVLGFLAFSFELILSTAYTLYLYNKIIFSSSHNLASGNFERTRHE